MGTKLGRRRDRQIVRVLWLLRALGEGAQLSVSELAKRFGTRRETVYRDLRTLEDIGYPIQGDENGRLSRPRLLDRKHTASPDLRLTPGEYSALALLMEYGREHIPFRKELTSAATKLKAAQPISGEETEAFGSVFGAAKRGMKCFGDERLLETLVQAILIKRRCNVTYRSPKHLIEKTYDYEPYRLRCVDGGLYCIGRIPAIGGLTTLATERIVTLKLTESVFCSEPDNDLSRYENEAFGVTLEEAITVVLRIRPDQAPYVSEREWHPSQTIRSLADGGVELTFYAGGAFEIERWILGWGDAVEVIAPESLRKRVSSTCEAMWSLYKPVKRRSRGNS